MKFAELRIFPGYYLTLGGEVVEILSFGDCGSIDGKFRGNDRIVFWAYNGRWEDGKRDLRDLVSRLPVDVGSSKLAAVIRGVWRCVNGQLVDVRDVGVEYATGVSIASREMRWSTFTGKLIDVVDTGWDLEAWVGFAPADEAIKTPDKA
jgi:hypothetical protein